MREDADDEARLLLLPLLLPCPPDPYEFGILVLDDPMGFEEEEPEGKGWGLRFSILLVSLGIVKSAAALGINAISSANASAFPGWSFKTFRKSIVMK